MITKSGSQLLEKTAALPKILTQATKWLRQGATGSTLRNSRQMAQRQQRYRKQMDKVPLGARGIARKNYKAQYGSPGTIKQQKALRNKGLLQTGTVYGGGALGASAIANSGKSAKVPSPRNIGPAPPRSQFSGYY